MDPLLRLPDADVWQTDDQKLRQTVFDIRLDGDKSAVESRKPAAQKPGEHYSFPSQQ